MSGTEVTRAWLISPALAELLRLAREVTACTAFNYPVLSLAVSLSLIHSGVLSTAGKALLNTTCVEIHIKPKESRKQEQRGIRGREAKSRTNSWQGSSEGLLPAGSGGQSAPRD